MHSYREHPSPSLPVLFSMLHPLDEVTPVICHTGGSTITSKVSFVTESSQQIVFTSEQPSLVVIYDKMISAHSVWSLRMAKVEVSVLKFLCTPLRWNDIWSEFHDLFSSPISNGCELPCISNTKLCSFIFSVGSACSVWNHCLGCLPLPTGLSFWELRSPWSSSQWQSSCRSLSQHFLPPHPLLPISHIPLLSTSE